MKYSPYLTFILLCCLYMHSSAQSIVHSIVNAQKNKILRIEALVQLLAQQGITVTDWTIELWKTGYEATLKVKEKTGVIYTVGVQCYTQDETYASLQSKEAFIEKMFAQANQASGQRSHWLRFFETQAPQVAIVDAALAVCDQSRHQTTVTIYSENRVKIKYTNHWNAKSLKHKTNYYMIDAHFDIAAGAHNLRKMRNEFVFGKTMKVGVSDGSSKQNRGCGNRMLANSGNCISNKTKTNIFSPSTIP
ncbi:hypothetical protein [Microscilla marina]|nr:hypothetical protein [Microscilla marina]